MKITDYRIMESDQRLGLIALVKEGISDGWEILGVPQRDDVRWWQAMVKRFDPHQGEVWVKEPGRPGRWERTALPVSE